MRESEYFFIKPLDIFPKECYTVCIKCEEQKPVGWRYLGESCRLVRGKREGLLEFLLLAVR